MPLDARRRTRRRARASTVRLAHARRGRRRSAGATTRSRLGARSASSVSALREPSRRCDEESRMRRGDVTRRTAAHTAARTCVDGTTGARTTRSAALGRRDESLAAWRSPGVAGVGSEKAEPAMRQGEQQQAAAASSSSQQQAAAASSSKQQQAAAASSSKQRQQAAASSGSKQQQAAAASSSEQHDAVGRREARRLERLTPIATARPLRRCLLRRRQCLDWFDLRCPLAPAAKHQDPTQVTRRARGAGIGTTGSADLT